MSLLKALLIASEASILLAAAVPPNPPPREHEKAKPAESKKNSIRERYVRLAALATGGTGGVILAAEIAAALAHRFPHHKLSSFIARLLWNGSATRLALRTTPTFLAGFAFAMLGGALRVACFRELGTHFTIELTLRDKHRLVTSGPYSVVRHPSYTGAVLLLGGITASALSRGTWWREAGVMYTPFGWVVGGAWSVILGYLAVILRRAAEEDKLLHKAFGEEWERWAERVPYKFIPWLIIIDAFELGEAWQHLVQKIKVSSRQDGELYEDDASSK